MSLLMYVFWCQSWKYMSIKLENYDNMKYIFLKNING